MSGADSEHLLAQALRAQAASGGGAEPTTVALPPGRRPRRLAAGWLLLIALVLGLIAGATAGLITVL